MFLGIDAAQKTGWCLLRRDGTVYESGVQDFTKRRGESNGLMFLRFRKWLQELIFMAPGRVMVCGYEQAHHRGGAATEIGVGLVTRVQEVCAEFGAESAPVHTGTLKKWSTGNGAAGKDVMKAKAAESLGRNPIDDNEADAVMVAKYSYAMYGDGDNFNIQGEQ